MKRFPLFRQLFLGIITALTGFISALTRFLEVLRRCF